MKRKQYKAADFFLFLIWRKRAKVDSFHSLHVKKRKTLKKKRKEKKNKGPQSPKRRLQALKILPFFCFFFIFFSMDLVFIVPPSMASSSSILLGGDCKKAVADWSWILQYLSETDEDLLIEKALFTADWSEAAEVTELFLLKTPPKLPPFIPSSSSGSETESWAVVGLLAYGVLDVGFWVFFGVWGKDRRSAKSMDLDLVLLHLRNFIFGYPFIFWRWVFEYRGVGEEVEVNIYVKTVEAV